MEGFTLTTEFFMIKLYSYRLILLTIVKVRKSQESKKDLYIKRMVNIGYE